MTVIAAKVDSIPKTAQKNRTMFKKNYYYSLKKKKVKNYRFIFSLWIYLFLIIKDSFATLFYSTQSSRSLFCGLMFYWKTNPFFGKSSQKGEE